MIIIAFEGIDGTGKSTSLKLASEFLSHMGISHLSTQELGGGEIQDKFRQLLIDSKTDIDELLAISMARRWHYTNILEPAIKEGKHILIDRFIESTWAYQGQKLSDSMLSFFENEIWKVPYPNLTIYFGGECLRKTPRDRFEKKEADFFEKAKQIYESRASIVRKSASDEIIEARWLVLKNIRQDEINSAILSAIKHP